MKKTRLISLLLTAALAVSCLPMAVSANTEEAENLLDGATYTGVEVEVESTDEEGNPTTVVSKTTIKEATLKDPDGTVTEGGNHFYSIAKRVYNVGWGFNINFDVSGDAVGQELFYKFNLRQAQPISDITSSGSYRYSAIRTQFYKNDVNQATSGAVGAGAWAGGAWATVGPTTLGTAVEASYRVGVIKASGAQFYHDIDIDNVQIYYNDAEGNPVYLVNVGENFDTTKDASGNHVAVTAGNSAKATYFEDIEEPYTIAYSDALSNTEITVDLAQTIEPGVYTLGGEFRLGEFTTYATDGTWGYNDSNHNDATIIVGAGDSTAEQTIDTVWADYEFEFVVEEATDTLTILVDGEETTVADPQKINFRNLTLVQSASFDEELAYVNDKNLLDGSVATYNGVWERNDGYLYIPTRTSATSTGFLDITAFAKPVAGRTYYIALDMWTETSQAVRININGGFDIYEKYAAGTDAAIETIVSEDGVETTIDHGVLDRNQGNGTFPIPVAGTCEDGRGAIDFDWENYKDTMYQQRLSVDANKWEHFEAYFTPKVNTTDRMKFSFTRGSSSGYIHAMAIDNVEIYYFDENDEKVVVYSNDFNNATDLVTAAGDISTQYDTLAVGIVNNGVAVTPISGGATAYYDVAAATEEAGEYTFTATVASEVEGGTAYLVATMADADATSVVSDAVAVTSEGAELTITTEPGVASIELVTTIEGAVTIANESLTRYFEAPMGDASGDGKVTPLDLIYFVRYIAGWADYTGISADVLDLNADGTVESGDAVALARHLAKWSGYEAIEDLEGMDYAN